MLLWSGAHELSRQSERVSQYLIKFMCTPEYASNQPTTVQYQRAIRSLTRDQHSSLSADRARQNWRRIGAIATRAGHDDTSDEENEEEMTLEEREEYHRKRHEAKIEREKTAKMMDLQYFLESECSSTIPALVSCSYFNAG
jgi:hypothetical protein